MTRKLKKCYSLFLSLALVINLVCPIAVQADTGEKIQEIIGTEIGGIISEDTTLTLEDSPYVLTQDIQIAQGATLTIEPGVSVKGNDKNLKTFGTLSAIGTSENKITFENVNIGINGKSSAPSFFDIQYADIYGGSVVKAGGNAGYGSFNLSDSYIKNVNEYMYLWYPTADTYIERNIFESSKGISVGVKGNINVFIRNNVFYNQKGNYAIQNWASYNLSETLVEFNSFLSNDRVALEIQPGYKTAKMKATNNYWNTTDEKIIDNMVFDNSDDLSCATTIEKSPILLEPHDNTPKVNFSELNLAVTEPVNGEKYFEIHKEIVLRFNRDIQPGELFNNIMVKDKNGKNVEISKEIEGNVLRLKASKPLELNTEYLVEIPMTSVKDSSGNNLDKDYSFRFTTISEENVTPIGGIISNDTILGVDKSPYMLTKDIQVAYGSVLNIEPGVVIKGNNFNIKTLGKFNAIGSENNKIKFHNLNIGINGTSKENALVDIQFSELYGGSLIAAGGNAEYGSFNLRDSYIKDTKKYMYVWYPTADVNIERNIFENAGGISVGTNNGIKVNIRNNVFYKQTGSFAIENWASYDSSETIVEYNSFLSIDRVALRLPKGYNNAKMTAINNYWNTEDLTIVDKMIFDKKDDLGSGDTIEISPMLLEPHGDTPKVDFSDLVVAVSNPYNGENHVSINKNIQIKFNKAVAAGDGFEDITLKDGQNNNIEISKSIEGNTLNITLGSFLQLGTSYILNIPMNAVSDLQGNNLAKAYSMNFKTKEESFTTEVGGIVSEDTTLTLENSPYSLTQDLQISYGATLNIEPGVIIKGNNNNINTWGVLNSIGTEKEKIIFEHVNIGLKGTSKENSQIDIQYSEVNGGSIIAPGGNGMYGSFNLRDSYIKNTKKYMYVWYPTVDVNIERNIFDNAGGISVGTKNGVKVGIKNNVFYKQTTDFAVENWASYDSSETIVEYNSFLSTDRIALKLPTGYDNAKMTAINNYWNTEDTSVIDNMIFDKKDDLGSSGEIGTLAKLTKRFSFNKEEQGNYISYEPFLTSKHENTPGFDYESLILSYFNFHYLKDKVMVDKPISIKFNKNIFEASNFDKIVLKDNNGDKVSVDITIDNNELIMTPIDYMYYDQSYKVEIAKDSLVDENGNVMEIDYSYEFTTEGPRFDMDNSSEVDILDIALLANTYNINSEEEGWNSLYDFNGDKIIDIFDLVMMAGKIN